MTIGPLDSTYMVYGRTYAEAVEVIRRRGLWTCIPDSQPWLGVRFRHHSDLTLFYLEFHETLDFSDALAIVPPWRVEGVESFLTDKEWTERIERYDLLAVEFFDPEDQRILEEEFGFRADARSTG